MFGLITWLTLAASPAAATGVDEYYYELPDLHEADPTWDSRRARKVLKTQKSLQKAAIFVNKYDPRAIPILDEAIAYLRVNARDHASLGHALTFRAYAHEDAYELSQAVPYLVEAVAVFERSVGEDSDHSAEATNDLGLLYTNMGDERAIETTNLAVDRARTAFGPRSEETGAVLLNRCGLWTGLGDGDAALADCTEAGEIFEAARGKSSQHLIRVLTPLAQAAYLAGDIEQANAHADRARSIVERCSDGDMECISRLRVVADAYRGIGDQISRLQMLEKARALADSTQPPNAPDVQALYMDIATNLLDLGRPADAVEVRREAVRKCTALYGDEAPYLIPYLSFLADDLIAAGDLDEARDAIARSLALAESAPPEFGPAIATAYATEGLIHENSGDVASARLSYERGLEILDNGADDPDARLSLLRGVAYNAVGLADDEIQQLYIDMLATAKGSYGARSLPAAMVLLERAQAFAIDDPAEAVADLRLADEIFVETSGERASHRVMILTTLSNYLRFAGALPQEAQQSALEAVRLSRAIFQPGHKFRGQAAESLIRAHLYAGDLEAAKAVVPDLRAVMEAQTTAIFTVASERERIAFVSSQQLSRDVLASVELASEDTFAAYESSLRWKQTVGRVMSEGKRPRSRGAVGELQDELKRARTEIAELTYRAVDPSELEAVAAKLLELSTEKERLEREIAAKVGPRHAANIRGADLETLCAAIPEGVAIVDFIEIEHLPLGDPIELWRYMAFIVDSSCEPEVVDLGDSEDIAGLANRYQKLLQAQTSGTRLQRAGEVLRKSLWEAIAPRVSSHHTVYVVPVGDLAKVPFAALPTEGGYLIDHHLFGYLGSATEVIGWDSSPSEGEASALVVGNVDFGEIPEGQQIAAGGCPLERFGALPGAAREAKEVTEILGKSGMIVDSRGGVAATEAAISAAMGSSRIVHLATHGFYRDSDCGEGGPLFNPMTLSGVALAGANGTSTDGDGLLTAEEVASFDLEGTELVVLSACQTGLGEIDSGGEGVLGLRRAISLAGADSLMVSLWSVDDEATLQLMSAFYRALTDGKTRIEALHSAQKAVLIASRKEFGGDGRPDRWGAFILAGEPTGIRSRR